VTRVIKLATVACLCVLMGACDSGDPLDTPSAGAGGAGGGLGGGLDSAGSGGSSGTGSAGNEAGSGGSAGTDDLAGAGGSLAAGSSGMSGAGGAGGSAGAQAGAGGAAGSAGAAGGGDKCSSPTSITNNAVARDADGKGQITQTNVCVPQLGVISSITLKYMLSRYFGDPARQAVFAYYADFSISDAFWVAQVMTTSGQPVMVNGKLVYVGWNEGSWPKPGGTFGTDSTGAPWWYETFAYYSGDVKLDGYVDEVNAKAIYNAGFTLDRLRIVKVGSYPVLY
jgi:hypothetical protein